jgi:hypothetical protein
MHHLLITIGAAALAFALWPGPAAAETSLGSLTVWGKANITS